MSDFRRSWLRLVVGLATVFLGAVEIQTVIQTLRAQALVRDRVVHQVHDSAVRERPRLAAVFRKGGPEAWDQAARVVQGETGSAEVEVFDASSGKRLVAWPGPAPVAHWPTDEEMQLVRSGTTLTLGPIMQGKPRLVTYVGDASGERAVIVRLAAAIPELVDDLQERRQLLLSHGAAVLVLLVAAALAFFPSRPAPEPWAPSALQAYEEAMGRLRDRGQALSREHEAEKRRMEEEIQDKEALARAGELTAGIVHEVRNGLGTIVGYARLAEHAGSPTEATEAARGIRDECEALETVVRRFMDYVRRETMNLAPLDLGRMLSRVAARESRGRAGGEVIVEGELGSIVGDEELLERAFENLVRNAREAAGVGGHVWIAASRADGIVTVTIADDGPGLPPDAPRSLRPFFSTKAGLGLGLPIALKILRLHEGELKLGARSPRGLTVTLRLPVGGPSK